MAESGYWAVLTAPILGSREVCDGAKLFYAEVSRRTNQRGYCWASNRALSGELGLSERTVSRYVAELERAGFISSELVGVSDRKRRRERRIRLAASPPFEVAKNGEINVDKTGESNVAKNGDIHKENNKSKNNTPLNPPRGICAWNEERFLKFWTFYRTEFCASDRGRAGERAEAAAAWDKLKPDDAMLGKMAAKLEATMKTRQWRDGYGIKMASTFLNGIRLRKIDLDELPEAARTETRRGAPVREEDEFL